VQRLPDQVLTDVRTVRVRGVDEVDAQLDRAPEHPQALVPIGRFAPDARSGDLHGSVAEPVDDEIPTEGV
jgi:hypothetical protein